MVEHQRAFETVLPDGERLTLLGNEAAGARLSTGGGQVARAWLDNCGQEIGGVKTDDILG